MKQRMSIYLIAKMRHFQECFLAGSYVRNGEGGENESEGPGLPEKDVFAQKGRTTAASQSTAALLPGQQRSGGAELGFRSWKAASFLQENVGMT